MPGHFSALPRREPPAIFGFWARFPFCSRPAPSKSETEGKHTKSDIQESKIKAARLPYGSLYKLQIVVDIAFWHGVTQGTGLHAPLFNSP